MDLRDAFATLCEAELIDEFLNQKSSLAEQIHLADDFAPLAHEHQEYGETGNDGAPWTTWLALGGRGAGKTRLGAEWVRALAHGVPPFADRPHGCIALVGETEYDAREVMIHGPSGLISIARPSQRPTWNATRRRLEWSNGAVAQVFSAADPESLRGPQFEAAWCDELAKWRYADVAFDTLQFGLRLGQRPRQIVTTTPRPIPIIKRLIADPRTRVTRAATRANKLFLAPTFLEMVVGRYAGTRLGRQELEGELIEDRADSLWSRELIESCRVAEAPPLTRIVVAIDPPGSSRRGADACGIVAAGRSESGHLYVLDDASAAGLSPSGWATKAVALYRKLEANRIVVEVNMGGEMVRSVLREVDSAVPLQEVHATRGKYLRAEPVAALYEQGKVKHVGAFPLLEDEMCDFGLDGLSSGRSPDRLDALVWALTALSERRHEGPRIRSLYDGPLVPRWAWRR
ncbi:DNA-packaging protein [Pseudolabrys sp. FHR47]|uniref:DNA-packaging protein n=1 Tax=Pseudolabrys sp. FHR47 TaxID=2562284 RepID=UPI0010BE8814|nr:terminase family protein [Pseudolabrys sp. FHR47]